MDEENRDKYFRTLIPQPPNHSSYNKYECVITTAPESELCDNECVEYEYSTESEASVRVSSTSNSQSSINKITPEKTSIPNSINCKTVPVNKEKGKYIAV